MSKNTKTLYKLVTGQSAQGKTVVEMQQEIDNFLIENGGVPSAGIQSITDNEAALQAISDMGYSLINDEYFEYQSDTEEAEEDDLDVVFEEVASEQVDDGLEIVEDVVEDVEPVKAKPAKVSKPKAQPVEKAPRAKSWVPSEQESAAIHKSVGTGLSDIRYKSTRVSFWAFEKRVAKLQDGYLVDTTTKDRHAVGSVAEVVEVLKKIIPKG